MDGRPDAAVPFHVPYSLSGQREANENAGLSQTEQHCHIVPTSTLQSGLEEPMVEDASSDRVRSRTRMDKGPRPAWARCAEPNTTNDVGQGHGEADKVGSLGPELAGWALLEAAASAN